MQTQANDFWKLFKPKCCAVKIKSTEKETVFEELVSNLVKSKELDGALAAAAVSALQDRERLASTGVGRNVAIPHVKLKGLESVVVSLSIHEDGVEWEALDGEDVRIVFLVLRPERAGDQHDPDRHLEMMQWVARLARDPDFRRFSMAAKTKKELVDLLKEKSGI